MKPLCVDLFCGLGGWAEGFLAEGYDVIGFDIERHDYGTGGYPGWLVLQDVTTLHGAQFKDAAVIVASPPCQAYSYRAMPWKRAKALPPPDNTLFETCWRIQAEACAVAGRHIPLIVENVKGAQKWVGRSSWHYGSFHIWGDLPALMPSSQAAKVSGLNWSGSDKPGYVARAFNDTAVARLGRKIPASCSARRWEDREIKRLRDVPVESSFGWNGTPMRKGNSKSAGRKAASAQIAKIPYPLSSHIARVYKPVVSDERAVEQHATAPAVQT